MSIRSRLVILAVSLLALIAAGLFLARPPWPGAGDGDKLREPIGFPADSTAQLEEETAGE